MTDLEGAMVQEIKKVEPSYTELVYETLRLASHPLPFGEIIDAVNARRPVTTRNPKSTIRNVLTQGRQLISLGDGTYGYLPHLLAGSLLRLPLMEKKPANRPLVFPEDVRLALWPSFFESGKRRVERPVVLRLPSGREITVPLQFFGAGTWGSAVPEDLRRYLIENYAAAGDSLLIRILDGEAGRGEVVYEPRRKQDAAAIERRNQEVADAAYQLFRSRGAQQLPIWDIVPVLLARGAYRSDIAPSPIEAILEADHRFVDAGWDAWMLAERMTSESEALIQIRKEGMREFQDLLAPGPPIAEEAPPVYDVRRAMERSLVDLRALFEQQQFASEEEANTYLQGLLAGGGVPRRRSTTPLEKAQDLMYDAWSAPNPRDRIRLAREALRFSPDCADAYVLLAEDTATSPKEAAAFYLKGVEAGERALGREFFEENAGDFWGMVETRPYMRARQGLAEALWAMGKQEQAIGHAWEMLRLNPGDNQGIRNILMAWLLEMGDDALVKKLLDLYPDDSMAMWTYARALHVFRTESDTTSTRQLLAEAIQGNPFVPDYLLGRKRFPQALPETIGFGDENEAIFCAVEQLPAWRKSRGALAWLEIQRRSAHPAKP